MMTKIDGFTIEPHGGSCFLLQWINAPQHGFKFEITSEHARLIETLPADVAKGDPLADAKRFESKALKAADKHRRQMFGSTVPS